MKRILAFLLALTLFVTLFSSLSLSAFAAGETNVFKTEMYLGDTPVNDVFVGEVVTAKISFQALEDITGYDFILKYDPTVLQLYDGAAFVTASGMLSSCAAATINNVCVLDFPASDYVFPNNGYVMYGGGSQSPQAIGSQDFISLQYKIKDEGNDILLVPVPANKEVEDLTGFGVESNETGIIVESANGDVAVTLDKATVNAHLKPDDPTNVAWPNGDGNYTASWTAPGTTCRGYTVKLYKDGTLKETYNVDADVTTYDFSNAISEYRPGTYTFGVIAKGGDDDSNEVMSGEKVVTATLLDSTSATYEPTTDTLSWDAVRDAAGYTVSVKNLQTNQVTDTDIDDQNTTSIADFLGDTVGDFEITVTAKAPNENYLARTENAISYSTGSTISGLITLVNASAMRAKKMNGAHMPTVTLTDITDSSKVYSAQGTKTAAGGAFAVKGVPQGDYYVTLTGISILTRELKNADGKKLYVHVPAESTTITISKGDGLGVYMGNVNGDATINVRDLTAYLQTHGCVSGDDAGYNAAYDFMDDDGIDQNGQEDLQLILNYYNKGQSSYQLLVDYTDNDQILKVKTDE